MGAIEASPKPANLPLPIPLPYPLPIPLPYPLPIPLPYPLPIPLPYPLPIPLPYPFPSPPHHQAASNYYAAFDPTALTRKEEEHLHDSAKRASEHQQHHAFVQQQTTAPLVESKQPTPADISAEREKSAATKQALLASAAKSGFADPRSIGYSEPMPAQLAVHDSFHDSNDQFRFGVLVKQPKGKSSLRRLARPPREAAPSSQGRLASCELVAALSPPRTCAPGTPA